MKYIIQIVNTFCEVLRVDQVGFILTLTIHVIPFP